MDDVGDCRGWVCDVEWDRGGPDEGLHGAWLCKGRRMNGEAVDPPTRLQDRQRQKPRYADTATIRVDGDLNLENDMIATGVIYLQKSGVEVPGFGLHSEAVIGDAVEVWKLSRLPNQA
jgi:hypothetical protein